MENVEVGVASFHSPMALIAFLSSTEYPNYRHPRNTFER